MFALQVVPEVRVRRRRVVQAPMAATDGAGGVDCAPWQEERIIDEPSQLPPCNQRYYRALRRQIRRDASARASIGRTVKKCNFPNGCRRPTRIDCRPSLRAILTFCIAFFAGQ